MMLRVDHAEFAQLLRSYFDHELASCEPITAELHRERSGWWTRIVQAISFFLVTSADYTITRRLNLGRV
jgi:cardiolipin synthase